MKITSVMLSIGTAVAAVVFLLYLLICPVESKLFCTSAILQCAKSVLPALFCFTVVSGFLIRSGFFYILCKPLEKPFALISGLPRETAGVYLLSFISGFPCGVISTIEYRKSSHLTRNDCARLAAVSDNTGPSLPLLLIGNLIFSNVRIGLYIYLIEIISSIITLAITKPRVSVAQKKILLPHSNFVNSPISAFCSSVKNAVSTCSFLCGYVIIFTVAGSALVKRFPQAAPLLPFFEVSNGIHSLLTLPRSLAFIIASSAISFGGLCVHFQAADLLISENIPLAPHFFIKLLQSFFAFLLASAAVTFINFSI